MSAVTYRVMFCCNNERGFFTGRVEIIEVSDEIRLVCQNPRPPTMKWTERQAYTNVQVGRRAFSCSNRQTCVGNVFWDSASLTEAQARSLVSHLLASGWAVEERARLVKP